MHLEEAKAAIKTVTELSICQKDLYTAIKGTSRQAAATKKLWHEGNKSRLIKIGIALIMFPDPLPVTDIVGAGFIVAGTIQRGIQNRSLYMEDITKTFQSTLKDICATKSNLQI